MEDTFGYNGTVFVRGNLKNYLEDLEGYFRWESREYSEIVELGQKNLKTLRRDIQSFKKNGVGFYFPLGNAKHITIKKDNYQKLETDLVQDLELAKTQFKALRMNRDKVASILDGEDISSLDLTNYAYGGYAVRIQHSTPNGGGEAIRMRIFRMGNPEIQYINGEGFAIHANGVEGVSARCEKESEIFEDPQSLESFVDSGKVRRSKLRVRDPEFEVRKTDKGVRYSRQISKEEMEMIGLLLDGGRPKDIHYGSRNWSPSQGKKMLRNLFGIVAINDQGSSQGRSWYNFVYVDSRNKEAVEIALDNGGVFKKEVENGDLSTLETVYDRTMELKKKYGSRFYPRFTAKEVSDRGKLSKEQAKISVNNLVGILAPVWEKYVFDCSNGSFYTGGSEKFFIPKSGMKLTEEVLNI